MATQLQKRKQGTATSAFGSPGRSNHDSSVFYNSRLYEGMSNEDAAGAVENEIPPTCLNKIYCKSSEAMEELPDNSVHLMITSPPYNVAKEYDDDLSLDEYLDLLNAVWEETYRVLVPGGRACINVANLGRKPYIPLHGYIIEGMHNIGYLMRGEIIWNKGPAPGHPQPGVVGNRRQTRCCETFMSISWYFPRAHFQGKAGRENTIKKEEFLEWTRSVWDLPTVSAKKNWPPGAFPGSTAAPVNPVILV